MLNKLVISVFFLILFTSACIPTSNPGNFVVVSANDGTPPTVGITINDGRTNVDVSEKSQPTTFPTGSDTVSVIVGATDEDGGIKAVKLWATFTKYMPGQIQGPGLASVPIKQDVSNAQIGESTLKNRFFQYNFDLEKELGGWTSMRVDIWAEGENFSGGKVTTPRISITYPVSVLAPASSVDVCARTGGAPVITIPDNIIQVGQTPGRQLIVYFLQNPPDVLIIIVDDAPGLTQDQMRVELDIDPVSMSGWDKAIEAWGFCRQGPRVNLIEASKIGGINVGTACYPLDSSNDFRSGCTNTQTMLLDRSITSEIWLRKPGFGGIWTDAEGIDSSIWQAFGGRSVRFIWRFD